MPEPDDKYIERALEPCPFCGGRASSEGHIRFNKPLADTWWEDGVEINEAFFVSCMRCGAVARSGLVGGFRTKSEAIDRWNTRAHARTLQEQDAQGEPVAWMYERKGRKSIQVRRDDDPVWLASEGWTETPLYAAPPIKQQQPQADWLTSLPDELRDCVKSDELRGDSTVPTKQPQADWLTEAREALHEAKLQLEYLDGRFPTGTTPVTITRVDAALEKLREAGHG